MSSSSRKLAVCDPDPDTVVVRELSPTRRPASTAREPERLADTAQRPVHLPAPISTFNADAKRRLKESIAEWKEARAEAAPGYRQWMSRAAVERAMAERRAQKL